MDQVGVRELRQNASRYLRRVAAGEEIEVTDRGTPVARLVPVPADDDWDHLLATGAVLPPEDERGLQAFLDDWDSTPPESGGRSLSGILEEMRENER